MFLFFFLSLLRVLLCRSFRPPPLTADWLGKLSVIIKQRDADLSAASKVPAGRYKDAERSEWRSLLLTAFCCHFTRFDLLSFLLIYAKIL